MTVQCAGLMVGRQKSAATTKNMTRTTKKTARFLDISTRPNKVRTCSHFSVAPGERPEYEGTTYLLSSSGRPFSEGVRRLGVLGPRRAARMSEEGSLSN